MKNKLVLLLGIIILLVNCSSKNIKVKELSTNKLKVMEVDIDKLPNIIGEVQEIPEANTNNITRYPVVDGYPIWILNLEEVKGFYTLAIGSAKVQSGGIEAQKRAAKMQAQAELARIIT